MRSPWGERKNFPLFVWFLVKNQYNIALTILICVLSNMNL